MPEKICEMCKTKFHLNQHKTGLVFDDKIFICEQCTTTATDEDLLEWSHTIMRTSENGMPVALWLIHEQNKNKPMFTKK